MKYILAIFFLVIFASCSDRRPDIESVTIQIVYSDSLSIRAIAPIDENRVWFASDMGKVGLIDGDIPKLATIKYQDSLLHFRSLAVTPNAIFVLSIANPAVLYKIDFDGQEATHIEDVYSETGEKVFYDSMKFWNDKEGIAMGDPTEDCLSVLITRDGGDHWTKLSCGTLPKTEPGEAGFAASNTNIALYGNHVWIATGGKRARVFHSSDKGIHWEVFNTPILQGRAMTGIYSIDFYNEKLGVIMGGDWENKGFKEGNKAITTDGGKTWKLIANGKGPGFQSAVKFVPGSEGQEIVSVGSPGISYSHDGGDSWKELSREGFYAIEFVNDTLAFASGVNRIAKLIFQ
jgi:photosystem II stability/assembly factor-like uncharacterized protein